MLALVAAAGVRIMSSTSDAGLTAVAGLKVGQHTLAARPTGCTVVVAEAGAVAGVDVRGAAPGTRETDLLNPLNLVDTVHAIVLSGGSAFGLDAASGVMRYLEERKIGFPTAYGVVPIVPAAILFDLGVGDPKVRPGADCGYAAASSASAGPIEEGNVGAGAGATIGKTMGMERAMKGGIGTAAISLPDGLTVAALVAVNAYGDVVDPATGRVVAGVRTEDGRGLADARVLLRSTKVAQMAHDGLARSITPVHSLADGDTLFALSTGTLAGDADVSRIGALAAEAVADAVLRAVRAAKGLPGLPAARDLPPSPR